MKIGLKILIGICVWVLASSSVVAQGSMCEDIEPFCAGDERLTFPNSNYTNSNQLSGEAGPDYGCLEEQPYPAWFFLQIEDSGNLSFRISQSENNDGSGAPLDVDFVVWGPFEKGEDYCNAQSLGASNIIDCSYLPDAVETMNIPNAQANQIYVVLITNFQQLPGYISLQQTNTGGGSTDCTILDSDLGDNIAVCGQDQYTLDGTTDEAETYEWYVRDPSTGTYEQIPGEEGPTLTVTQSGDYRLIVKDTVGGSEDQDDVRVVFYEEPQIGEVERISVCSEEESQIDLTQAASDLLGPDQNSADYRVEYYANQEDLENEEQISQPSSYTFEPNTSILARIQHLESGCYSRVKEIELGSFQFPEFELPEFTVFCVDLDNQPIGVVTLGEDLGNEYEYQWFVNEELVSEGPVIEFAESPNQEITVKINHSISGCTREFSTTPVEVSRPQEIEVDISGSDFGKGYTVNTVLTAGIGSEYATFEFRLDNGEWQESPVFREVPPGSHQISVRELNGCGQLSSDSFFLVGYPRFFTPNADGYNDTWTLITDQNIQLRQLYIFDRYGKLIKQLDPSGNRGWDGTYNGNPMPADDYWFRVVFLDEKTGEINEYKAHFSLIR